MGYDILMARSWLSFGKLRPIQGHVTVVTCRPLGRSFTSSNDPTLQIVPCNPIKFQFSFPHQIKPYVQVHHFYAALDLPHDTSINFFPHLLGFCASRLTWAHLFQSLRCCHIIHPTPQLFCSCHYQGTSDVGESCHTGSSPLFLHLPNFVNFQPFKRVCLLFH